MLEPVEAIHADGMPVRPLDRACERPPDPAHAHNPSIPSITTPRAQTNRATDRASSTIHLTQLAIYCDLHDIQIMQSLQSLKAGSNLRRPTAWRPQPLGFTAIELMVVVAILAILTALAAPSFTPLIERWRVMQAVDGLQSTLYFARSEAIKRGGNVVIRKEPTGTNGCNLATANTDWDCGWYVFVDTNRNGTLNSGEEVLQRFAPPSNVMVTRTGGGVSIQLSRWGTIEGTYIGFNIVPLDKSTSDPAARGLCMSSAGRIRTVKSVDIPCTN